MPPTIEEAIAEMEAAVTETETVEGSAAVLLPKLGAIIEANKNAPAALSALAARLKAPNSTLLSAITANTPAEA